MAEAPALPATVVTRPCRYGLMSFLYTDAWIGRSLSVYGEFSEGECALFRQLVAPGAWAVEAGANVGAHTLALARMAGPGGRVLAFEPQAVLARLLEGNVAAAGIANVRVCAVALGRAEGSGRVPVPDYDAPGNFGGVAVGTDGEGVETPVSSVDTLSLGRCDLLKADVEGMELEVLRGAERTIARTRPTLYLENDRRERSPALLAALRDLDYRVWWHLPPLFNPGNFRRCRQNVFRDVVSANLLCLPAERVSLVSGLREVRSPEEWWC